MIHASLLFGLRVAGSHIYEPPFRAVAYSSLAGVAAVGYFAEIESVTSVWRSELGREERLHGKCGDLEDAPIVLSFAAGTQA